MKHAPGKLDCITLNDNGTYCQLIGQVLENRSGVIADSFNRDAVIDPEEDLGNLQRLALCWNTHDALVAELQATADWLEEQAQAVEKHYGGGIVPARLRGRATVIKQTLFNLENQ